MVYLVAPGIIHAYQVGPRQAPPSLWLCPALLLLRAARALLLLEPASRALPLLNQSLSHSLAPPCTAWFCSQVFRAEEDMFW